MAEAETRSNHKYQKRADKYEKKHDGEMYATSKKAKRDARVDKLLEKARLNRMISKNEKEYAKYETRAQNWAKRHDDLMNTPVSAVTSRKEINQIYKS